MAVITEESFKAFEKTYKVGLVSTVDDEGDPHVSLLSSIMAKNDETMLVGEFITGLSKEFMQKRKKCGFLIMSLEKCFWQGKMDWECVKTEGEDYIKYNNQPMYRYNTYCGISKVHYFKLKEITEKCKLDMAGVIKNALKVSFIKGKYRPKQSGKVMIPWAEKLCSGLSNLKYVCFVDDEGYPVIIPAIQAQANSDSRLVLKLAPYSEQFAAIKDGSRVAVFVMNLDMDSVLIKGAFKRVSEMTATIDIDRVYNSMPPKHGYVYPRIKNEAVKIDDME